MSSSDARQFVKLRRSNDWGAVYLAVDPMREGGGADIGRRIRLKAGDRVTIRFPDGHVAERTVVTKVYHTTVGDMGHDYPVSYELPGFLLELHGVSQWVALDKVEVRL